MAYSGRRTLYLYGCILSFILMLTIGFCGLEPSSNSSVSWALGGLLIIFTFAYDSTVEPVCYSLVAEIPSTRLKAKTIVITRSVYSAGAITVDILVNYQMTTTAWDWKAKFGFFCCIWVFFRLPEPNGRMSGELDNLFEQRVSARKFKTIYFDRLGSDYFHIDGSPTELIEHEGCKEAITSQPASIRECCLRVLPKCKDMKKSCYTQRKIPTINLGRVGNLEKKKFGIL